MIDKIEEKKIEEIIGICFTDESELDIESVEQKSWGRLVHVYVSSIETNPEESFQNIIQSEYQNAGVDDNFSDQNVLYAEIQDENEDDENEDEDEDVSKIKLIAYGWHSSGQYSDNDYEGSFSGYICIPDERSFDKAKAYAFEVYQSYVVEAAMGKIKESVDLLSSVNSLNQEKCFTDENIQKLLRLMAAAK